MKKKIEILSPAGSYESLIAAIAAGADAVYIGGTRFGARAYADNLDEQKLLDAIDYVHLHGRKIYLTINTLLKEQELNQLYDYLLPYYKQGLDAVIVQDIGVLKYVKEHFPDLPIHASTQMTITNVQGAKFLEELGVERVVTARELNLDEVKEIANNTNMEIESFVHGALCYCYSGQCLYSSLIGGRSGNRGQCAQPCRLPYKVDSGKEQSYVLSLKDICTLEIIPELVEAGIDSFKIEGRMKKPEYVALVTAMYRKYVDLYITKGKDGFKVNPKDREQLMDLYNRGGSHNGYYQTQNGREMLSLKRPNHAGTPALQVISQSGRNVVAKAIVEIHKGDVIEINEDAENYTFAEDIKVGQKITFVTQKKQYIQKGMVLNRIRNDKLVKTVKNEIIERKIQEKIVGNLELSLDSPSKLTIRRNDICVEVLGDVAQKAINQPMDEERIKKQMCKTGNTPFVFESLEVIMHDELFVPLQSLNELRRVGLEKLEKTILEKYRRIPKVVNEKEECSGESISTFKPVIHVYVEQYEQWEASIQSEAVDRIYLDCNVLSRIWENTAVKRIISETHKCKKEMYLALPHIFRKNTVKIYEEHYHFLVENDWDGLLIRNYESYLFLKEHQYTKPIVTDYNMYQFNKNAKSFWLSKGIETTTAPLELNFKELKEVGLEQSELVVYGYFPMMISAQCVKKTTEGCKKEKGKKFLIDRYQKSFCVKNNCDYCYNVIYNTAPVVLTDQKSEIYELKPKALRMHFTIENKETTSEILALYNNVFVKNRNAREPEFEFTRGHFKRGIK